MPAEYTITLPAASVDAIKFDPAFGYRVASAIARMKESSPVEVINVGWLNRSHPVEVARSAGDGRWKQELQVFVVDGQLRVFLDVDANTRVRFFDRPPRILLPGDTFEGRHRYVIGD